MFENEAKDDNYLKNNKLAIMGLVVYVSIWIFVGIFKIASTVLFFGLLGLSTILEVVSLIKKETDRIVSIITLIIIVLSTISVIIVLNKTIEDFTNDTGCNCGYMPYQPYQ